MSLREPPKKTDSSGRVAARVFLLLILLAVAGLVIYAAVTNQRIDLTEDQRVSAVELDDPAFVEGFRVNVVSDGGEGQPVVILHDVDVTGGLTLADLSASLGRGFSGVRVDLPGFGYTDRIPQPGQAHTVASMADVVATIVDERFGSAYVIGIGFGGEVAAEMAYSHPTTVDGFVMVDVDLSDGVSFEESLEQLPWIGRAATFTWETGGRFAIDDWAPDCSRGGWCPSEDQLAQRAAIVELADTTDSIWAFRRTAGAALAPANLADIGVPAAYVWSTSGAVTQESVDEIEADMGDLQVFESATFAAQLEDPATITAALGSLAD